MASAPTETTLAALWDDAGPCDLEGLTDAELLNRFLGPDETAAQGAFRELVRRHGPRVLGVCRRILGRVHDAEDAFQATFLMLARKAGSIRDCQVLGRWLHRVAQRIAVSSKTDSDARRAHERRAAEISAAPPGPEHDPARRVLRLVLHEEVDRLPATYRSAVVLCYLEECTNEQAAALLRWPVGTVKSRLARARELLRARLTRRGLAPDRV
jgi:RNA polymerase sigma factor (sigma-70 family)